MREVFYEFTFCMYVQHGLQLAAWLSVKNVSLRLVGFPQSMPDLWLTWPRRG